MFCENCGKTIPDTSIVCPHCKTVTSAVPVGSTGSGSLPAISMPPSRESRPLMAHVERAIYFRIARGSSWILLAVVTLGLIGNSMVLVPQVLQAVGTSTSIEPKELSRAVASPSSVLAASGSGDTELNPAELAQLDKVGYEIIQVLPGEARNGQEVDRLRGWLRNNASNLSNERDEQLAFLRELHDDLREVPEGQRTQAINTYFALKARAINEAKIKKEAAQQKLILYGSTLVSGIALLTLATMILVLLSIERNTRPSAA